MFVPKPSNYVKGSQLEEESVLSSFSKFDNNLVKNRTATASQLTKKPLGVKSVRSKTSPRATRINKNSGAVNSIEAMYQSLQCSTLANGTFGSQNPAHTTASILLNKQHTFYVGDQNESMRNVGDIQLNETILQGSIDREKSFIIATGNIKNDDKIILYTIREFMGTCFSINLNVPLTGQNWVVFVPLSEVVSELIRIWNNQSKQVDYRAKVSAWILGCITIEFEEMLIVSAQFDHEAFRKRYFEEIVGNVNRAAIIIQALIRGFISRRRQKVLIAKMYRIRQAQLQAQQRIKQVKLQRQQQVLQQQSVSGRHDAMGYYGGSAVSLLKPGGMVDNNNSIFIDNHNSNHKKHNSKIKKLKTAGARVSDSSSRVMATYGASSTYNTSQSMTTAEYAQLQYQLGESSVTSFSNKTSPPPTMGPAASGSILHQDLHDLKAELGGALDSFQHELETLRNQIKQKSKESAPETFDAEYFHQHRRMSSISAQLSPRVVTRGVDSRAKTSTLHEEIQLETEAALEHIKDSSNVDQLKAELSLVMMKVGNLQELLDLQRKTSEEMQQKAKSEIAKARISAEIAAERAAERVKAETIAEMNIKIQNSSIGVRASMPRNNIPAEQPSPNLNIPLPVQINSPAPIVENESIERSNSSVERLQSFLEKEYQQNNDIDDINNDEAPEEQVINMDEGLDERSSYQVNDDGNVVNDDEDTVATSLPSPVKLPHIPSASPRPVSVELRVSSPPPTKRGISAWDWVSGRIADSTKPVQTPEVTTRDANLEAKKANFLESVTSIITGKKPVASLSAVVPPVVAAVAPPASVIVTEKPKPTRPHHRIPGNAAGIPTPVVVVTETSEGVEISTEDSTNHTRQPIRSKVRNVGTPEIREAAVRSLTPDAPIRTLSAPKATVNVGIERMSGGPEFTERAAETGRQLAQTSNAATTKAPIIINNNTSNNKAGSSSNNRTVTPPAQQRRVPQPPASPAPAAPAATPARHGTKISIADIMSEQEPPAAVVPLTVEKKARVVSKPHAAPTIFGVEDADEMSPEELAQIAEDNAAKRAQEKKEAEDYLKEQARIKICRFGILAVKRIKYGENKTTIWFRAAALSRIVDESVDVDILTNAFKTGIESNNTELSARAISRLRDILQISDEIVNAEYTFDMTLPYMSFDVDTIVFGLDFFFNDIEILADACAVIDYSTHYSTEVDMCKPPLISLPDTFLKILEIHFEDNALCFRIFNILFHVLTVYLHAQLRLGKEDAWVLMTKILKTHATDENLLDVVIRVITLICTNNSGISELAGELGMCDTLCQVYEDNIPSQHMLGIVSRGMINLCGTDCILNQRRLLSERACNLYRDAIRAHQDHPDTLEQVMWTVMGGIGNNKDNKRIFQDSEVLDAMADCLALGLPSGAIVAAIWSISNLSSVSNKRQKALNLKVLRNLRVLEAESDSLEIQRYARMALARVYGGNARQGSPSLGDKPSSREGMRLPTSR